MCIWILRQSVEEKRLPDSQEITLIKNATLKNDNNSCQLNGSGNGVVFIETAKIWKCISGR